MKSTVAVKQEQGGETRVGRTIYPLFEPAKLLIMTPRPSIEIPAQ